MSNLIQPTQIRDTQIDPPWLQGPNGQKFLYTIRVMFDVLLDKQNQAMRAHIPGQGTPTALPYLSSDRLIAQGPTEPAAAFAGRLSLAFDSWSRAGARRAILEQVAAYLQETVTSGAQLPEAAVVGGNSTYTSWDVIYNTTPIGAEPAHSLVTPPNWNWDGTYRRWWQWLILFFHLVPTGQSGIAATLNATAVTGDGLGTNSNGVWVPDTTAVSDSAFVTVTGMSGLTSANLYQWVTISNAASSVNNGTWQITRIASTSSAVLAMPTHVVADAHNGSIHWSISEYPVIGPAPVAGSIALYWGDQTVSMGIDVPEQTIESIRSVLALWKKADSYYQSIIVAFDGADGSVGSMFAPTSLHGSGNPDGTWGSIGKNVAGVWVPSYTTQSPFDCFCNGTGQYVDCSEQNVT